MVMRARDPTAKAEIEAKGFESLRALSREDFSARSSISQTEQKGEEGMPNDKIIVELRLHESGKLKAFADVTIPSTLGEITVRGFRVVQDGTAAPWVAFPTISYMKAGAKVNKQIVEVSRGLKSQLADSILTEYRDALNGGSELPVRS
jgi:DNA-binding cell septation regulator SpoVG